MLHNFFLHCSILRISATFLHTHFYYVVKLNDWTNLTNLFICVFNSLSWWMQQINFLVCVIQAELRKVLCRHHNQLKVLQLIVFWMVKLQPTKVLLLWVNSIHPTHLHRFRLVYISRCNQIYPLTLIYRIIWILLIMHTFDQSI